MANPFDQFDSATNPFDQFDQPTNGRAKAKTWSDVPAAALKNAPESAGDFASNLYQMVRHPIDTAGNTIDVLAGGLRAGVKAMLPDSLFDTVDVNVPVPLPINMTKEDAAAKASAVGQALKNRYGSGEAIKDTLATDPVGALADASAVLTAPEMLAGRAAGTAGRVASKVGSAIDPLANAGRVAGAVTDFGGNRLANLLGITTGVGTDPIKAAYQAGKEGSGAFINGIKGNATAEDVVGQATNSMQQLYGQRGENYLKNTEGMRGSTAQLDTQPILDAMVNAETKFKNNSGFVKDPVAKSALDEILSTTADWQSKNRTPSPSDFNDLKQAIGTIRDNYKPGTRAYSVADDVYKSVDAQLKEKVPGYAKAMKGYADESNDLRQLSQTMSLKGPNTNVDTAARKLLSGLRDNVNTNFGQRKNLLEQLNAENPDLIPTLAGMSMSSATPRGLAAHVASIEGLVGALHNPMVLAGIPLTSPKLVGYGAYGVGRAADKAGAINNYIRSRGLMDTLPLSSRINGLLGQ